MSERRRLVASLVMAGWTLFTIVVLVGLAIEGMLNDPVLPYVGAIALGVASSMLLRTSDGHIGSILAGAACAIVLTAALLASPTRYDDVGTWLYLLAPAFAAAIGWPSPARTAKEAR